ncbi:MAG: hypothetical protein ACKO34_03325 [Vampirovibrionales bacterium]
MGVPPHDVRCRATCQASAGSFLPFAGSWGYRPVSLTLGRV